MSTLWERAEAARSPLLKLEGAVARRLVQQYAKVYIKLFEEYKGLEAEIEALGGEYAGFKRARLRALAAQIEAEINRFGGWADIEIGEGARKALGVSQAQAQQLALGVLPDEARAAISTVWNKVPTDAVERMFEYLADDSPLRQGLARELGAGTAQAVADGLFEAVTKGTAPRQLAGVFRRELGIGLTKALRVSRTAILYSSRDAAILDYAANPQIVKGWVWNSARNGRTCFPAGTKVTTRKGILPIESIRPGDSVLTHRGRYRQVSAVSCRPRAGCLVHILANGYSLKCTPEHPLLVQRQGQLYWIEASNIGLGDRVFCERQGSADIFQHGFGEVPIQAGVWNTNDTILVYNLEVAGDHSFIANGMVVHNCLACIAMDGTVHPNTERLNDHWNGRCFPVAIPIDWEELGIEGVTPEKRDTGADWFGTLNEVQQRAMMSGGKYDAWKEGRLDIRDFAAKADDPVWGEMIQEASLEGILGDEAKKYYKRR